MKARRLTPAQTRALAHQQSIDAEVAERLALMDAVSAICKELGVSPEEAAAIYDERAETARLKRWAEEYAQESALAEAMKSWG